MGLKKCTMPSNWFHFIIFTVLLTKLFIAKRRNQYPAISFAIECHVNYC